MSQRFSGQVEVLDSSAKPKVRIALSGNAGTAQFNGEQADSPSTTVAHHHIHIGKKSSKITTLLGSGRKSGNPIHSDEGVAAPPPGVAVDTTGEPKTFLTIGDRSLPGGIFINGASGKQVFKINGVSASVIVGGEGNGGDLFVLDSAGEVRIRLNGNTGDIELTGADCAEEFDVEGRAAWIEPGTVMCLADEQDVVPSSIAYDKRVAGIVSGAGRYRPGILLDKVRGPRERVPLALTGKAFCKVDANYGPVEIGDLLTTSATLGFAMKVLDPRKASGSVIGKAMQSLSSGQGLIPVLVGLT